MYIVTFSKTMQTKIIGQPQLRSNAQTRRVSGYTYSFLTSVSQDDFGNDFETPEDIIIACVHQGLCVPSDGNMLSVKDFEISLDIGSGLYSVRFTTNTALPLMKYDMQVSQAETGFIIDFIDFDENYGTNFGDA